MQASGTYARCRRLEHVLSGLLGAQCPPGPGAAASIAEEAPTAEHEAAVLSQQELDDFATNGWMVLRNAGSRADCDAVVAAIHSALGMSAADPDSYHRVGSPSGGVEKPVLDWDPDGASPIHHAVSTRTPPFPPASRRCPVRGARLDGCGGRRCRWATRKRSGISGKARGYMVPLLSSTGRPSYGATRPVSSL